MGADSMNDAGRIGFVIKGAYDATATYDFLDVVYYKSASYVAKKLTVGNVPQESNEYWQVLAKSDTLTNISDATVDFTIAQTRVNIQSGEDSKTLFGKIKRWFADLKDVAFTGKYSDLTGQPTSLKNPNALTFTGAVTGNYDGSAAKSVAIPSVGNGTLTIQKNGVNVQTFTANQSGNVTANITVPTNAAGVGAVATSKVLTTKEQINANTDTSNVAGATAVKTMVSEINSNLSNYIYPPLASGDADNIQTNFHKFVFNISNTPERFGFLDVSVFDGKWFTPSPEGVVCQRFTGWTGKERIRCFYNNIWSDWHQTANITDIENSKKWTQILSTQVNDTHEIPALSGAEVLLTYGYVYRIQNTLTIPMDVFSTANGEGGKILFSGLEIQVLDSTHISIGGLYENNTIRVFVR